MGAWTREETGIFESHSSTLRSPNALFSSSVLPGASGALLTVFHPSVKGFSSLACHGSIFARICLFLRQRIHILSIACCYSKTESSLVIKTISGTYPCFTFGIFTMSHPDSPSNRRPFFEDEYKIKAYTTCQKLYSAVFWLHQLGCHRHPTFWWEQQATYQSFHQSGWLCYY